MTTEPDKGIYHPDFDFPRPRSEVRTEKRATTTEPDKDVEAAVERLRQELRVHRVTAEDPGARDPFADDIETVCDAASRLLTAEEWRKDALALFRAKQKLEARIAELESRRCRDCGRRGWTWLHNLLWGKVK